MRAARLRSAVVILVAFGVARVAYGKPHEGAGAPADPSAISKGSEAAPGPSATAPPKPPAKRPAAVAPKAVPSVEPPKKPEAGAVTAKPTPSPNKAESAKTPGKTEPVPAPDKAAKAGSPTSGAPAAPEPVGPGLGQGERKIRQPERLEAEAASAGPGKKKNEPGPSATPASGHRLGRAPKHPNPTLPAGAPPPQTDEEARRQIVGGPTADDAAAAKPDAELRELRDAERALFPKPLRGARTGWSWDLPVPVDDGSPAVLASGLPPGFPLGTSETATQGAKESDFLKSLTLPNLPTRLDARVVRYLKFYRDDPRGKNILRTWAKKCGRLAPAVRAELAKAGLPTDLVWLSLIESGHNPTIVSPAGAAGLWQFMPESARLYGLTVDRWVDERLDPERSTEAAVRYLNDLRSRFGSWELAMAAYNMGHGGLLRAVRKFNTNDFWALSRYEAGLPWETTLYVPKILATAVVMANKSAFGIEGIEQDPAISFDTVSCGPNVDLADVARAADAPPEDIRALNAEYLSGRTPPPSGAPRRFPVRVPAGRGLVTEQRLAAAAHRPGPVPEPHVVRFGDTLEAVAAEHGASVRDVAQLNHVTEDERLSVGSVLLVPTTAAPPQPKEPTAEEVVVVPARRFVETKRKRVFYRVLPGDHVAQVADAFGVSRSELAAWNAVDPAAQLQPGMTLQVLVRPDFDLSRVRCLAEHEARLLVAGSAEFFDHFEAQNGRKRLSVTAKKGDTYAAIGRRYGMSPTMMERINRVPAATPLSAGDRVVVYTKGDAEGVSSEADLARELSAIAAPLPDALPPMPPVMGAAPNGQRAVAP